MLQYIPPIQKFINPALSASLQALNGSQFIARFFPALISMFFVIGVVIFIFVFLIGAVQWINSGGDKASLEAAKDRITQAVIGLAILLSLYAIVNLIQLFFGTNITYFNLNIISL